MLSPHPRARLEYWFFKVNSGPVALLVDWIARRGQGEFWLRASIHSPYRREVLFQPLPLLSAEPEGVSALATSGAVGEIEWDLRIHSGGGWIAPDIVPARVLGMTDLALVSQPTATFTGRIRHGPQEFHLQHATGLVSHYWGRRLPSEWWWISAGQFDRPDVAVECSVLRSGLWGLDIRLPLGYLFLRDGSGESLHMAPPGSARVLGTPDHFTVTFQRVARPALTLEARGREYGEFGERIVNTLVGDLEIREGSRVIAACRGTAGLERRFPG